MMVIYIIINLSLNYLNLIDLLFKILLFNFGLLVYTFNFKNKIRSSNPNKVFLYI